MIWYANWQVNPGWLKLIQYVVVVMFIKKNLILNIYFKSNYIFLSIIRVVFKPVNMFESHLINFQMI
jgi:hypothetical protein